MSVKAKAKEMQRKAKHKRQQHKNQHKAVQKTGQAIEEMKSITNPVRERLLEHIIASQPPRSIVENMPDTDAMFIQTAEQTLYTQVPQEELVNMIPAAESSSLRSFLVSNQGKKIVAIQEDESPLLTFAFEDYEIAPPSINKLPEPGVYRSTNDSRDMSFYVERAYGDNPEEFYLVELIEPENKDDSLAMGVELDKKQWESLVARYELKLCPAEEV